MLYTLGAISLVLFSAVSDAASTTQFYHQEHVNAYRDRNQKQHKHRNSNRHNGYHKDDHNASGFHHKYRDANRRSKMNDDMKSMPSGDHHNIYQNGNILNDRLIQFIDVVSEPGGTGISAYKSSDSDDRIEIPEDWEVEITARMPISVAEQSKIQDDGEFVFGGSFVQHSLKSKDSKRLAMPSKIMVPLEPKRFDKYLLDPCFKNKYLHEKDTTFYVPNVKADRNHGQPQCLTYDSRQKAFEIVRINAPNFEQQSKPVVFKIDQPQYYYWAPTEMEAASKYCVRNGCPDRDPLVFYTDQYVGFWHGWADNWFQGYKVTPDSTYSRKSDNPTGVHDPKNEFNFLRFKGYKWASAEHFLRWTRDQLLLNGAHSDDLLLEHPQRQVTIDKKTKTNTSPRQAFHKSRDWLNEVLPSRSDPRRQAWYNCNFFVQIKALWLKFTQNDRLKAKLLGTSNRQIFQASPYDDTFGVYPSRSIEESGLMDALRANDEHYFVGEFGNKPTNMLGRALMVTRELIKLSNKLGRNRITFDDLKVESMNHILYNATNSHTFYHDNEYGNHHRGAQRDFDESYHEQHDGDFSKLRVKLHDNPMVRVLRSLQYADLQKCQPILLEKGLAWLELDTFEMTHKSMEKDSDMYTDDYNGNGVDTFGDVADDGGYFDGGYHAEL